MTGFVVVLAYRHVDYAHELWWQFEVDAHAPRSLRALAGGVLALQRLPRARRGQADPLPAEHRLSDVRRARAWMGRDGRPDRGRARRAALAGVAASSRRPTATAASPPSTRSAPTTSPASRPRGPHPRQPGQEARGPPEGFSLSGPSRAKLRQAGNRMAREGAAFDSLAAKDVPALLDEPAAGDLRSVARPQEHAREVLLARPLRPLLPGAPAGGRGAQGRAHRRFRQRLGQRGEGGDVARPDAIRRRRACRGDGVPVRPADAVGTRTGYRWFSLGMAPLAGLEEHRLAPLWNKLGALLFRHGEHFYNFQGLRAFLDKFDPTWEPRYLASPGGLATPFAVGHVAALVNGGVSGVVTK